VYKSEYKKGIDGDKGKAIYIWSKVKRKEHTMPWRKVKRSSKKVNISSLLIGICSILLR
jgi:hypothetical protein